MENSPIEKNTDRENPGKVELMKAIVVYESLWGNTAAVAKAIAEGIGSGARALSTAEATAAVAAGADLLVGGAPVLGFSLAGDMMLKSIATNLAKYKRPPDLSQPSMSSWLEKLAPGNGRAAAFETRIWWSPGGATGGIEKGLARVGYTRLAKAQRFIVEGAEGPLRAGELEKAKAWGAELARAMK
jgi:flavorubredoxin